MTLSVLTGYLVLAHLQACLRDDGCMLDSFTTQKVINFKPQTLSKSGCSMFTVRQAYRPGSFHLSACARYLQIDDSRVSTVDNPHTEVEFVSLNNMSAVTSLNGPVLADTTQPFCIAQHFGSMGKDCLVVSSDNSVLKYAKNADCLGKLLNHASWNFVAEKYRVDQCAGSCPVSVFSGFTVNIKHGSDADPKNTLLFSKPLFGVLLKAGSSIEVIGRPRKLGFLSINCAASISYLCFETRKVTSVTLTFHNTMGKVVTRKVKPKYPPMYRKTCVKKLPKKEVYQITFKFTLIAKTKAFFFRKLDMGGCHKIM